MEAAAAQGEWLHVVAPTEADLAALRARGVPDALLTHVGDPDERPRVEHAGDVVLVVLQCPRARVDSVGAPYTTVPLSIFLTPGGVATVAPRALAFVDQLWSSEGRVPKPSRAGEFVLRIFWHLADAYLGAVREINAAVERLEDKLRRSLRNEEVLGLLEYQKSLTYLATGMSANELVLERVQRVQALHWAEQDQEFLDDVRVEVRQAIDMAAISDNILSQMMDAFASIVSNNLNSVLKVLTSVTILLAIPTLVASLYGMNVALPGVRTHWAFAGIVLGCVALCVALIVVFRRRNWL